MDHTARGCGCSTATTAAASRSPTPTSASQGPHASPCNGCSLSAHPHPSTGAAPPTSWEEPGTCLAAALRDALVQVASQLRPRGARHLAVLGRLPILVHLAVLHLRRGAAGGGRRRAGMSEGMRRVQGRASSWIPKFCRAPKSKQQLELHSVTEQHHPHSRHSVGSPTWSSRRCHRSALVPETGRPHSFSAALSSPALLASLTPPGSSSPARTEACSEGRRLHNTLWHSCSRTMIKKPLPS